MFRHDIPYTQYKSGRSANFKIASALDNFEKASEKIAKKSLSLLSTKVIAIAIAIFTKSALILITIAYSNSDIDIDNNNDKDSEKIAIAAAIFQLYCL